MSRGGVQRLPGEEGVASNEVTPWQPGVSSHSPPPTFRIFPLGPMSECAHPLTPHPPPPLTL